MKYIRICPKDMSIYGNTGEICRNIHTCLCSHTVHFCPELAFQAAKFELITMHGGVLFKLESINKLKRYSSTDDGYCKFRGLASQFTEGKHIFRAKSEGIDD